MAFTLLLFGWMHASLTCNVCWQACKVDWMSIYLPPSKVALSCIDQSVCHMPILTINALGKALVCMLYHVYTYSTGTGVPSSGSTLGHQLNFCFTQRRLSLHWTVKCSNLFLLGPDASWMAVKIAAGLWYMGFPVLTLGSPFLFHIITKASTLSQREMEDALLQ